MGKSMEHQMGTTFQGSEYIDSTYGFPRIRDPVSGICRIGSSKDDLILGLYWSPPVLGNYHRSYVLRDAMTV